MSFPATPALLELALVEKLRATAAPDGAPWDDEDELKRAAKETTTNDWLPIERRRPWMVAPRAQGPPNVEGYAVVRAHDLIHPPVKRGPAEENGVYWRPTQEKAKPDHVMAALNALEDEAEKE
jgi:hypothetical protein